MIEILLAALVLLTIAIDSIVIILKGMSDQGSRDIALFASASLLYVTRGSVVFLLPLCGLVLDGVVQANLALLCAFLSGGLLLHAGQLLLTHQDIVERLPVVYRLYRQSALKVFLAPFYLLTSLRFVSPLRPVNYDWWCVTGFFVLSLLFPAVLVVGTSFPEMRASIISGYGAFTGIFALYMTLVVDRGFALSKADKAKFTALDVIYSKCVGMGGAAIILVVVAIYGSPV